MTSGQRGLAPLRLLQRRGASIGLAGLVAGAALLVPSAAPAEEAPDLYSAFASGDGMRINFRVPDFLVLEDFIDAGAPATEASLDSVDSAKGFASAPYPGQAAIGGPGLFAFFSGLQVPASYPWYAASADPATPSTTVDQNGIHLESTSSPTGAHSAARMGAEGSGRTASEATVGRAEDGTVTAAASTLTDVFHIGPIVISGLTSKASVVRHPGGEPERTSSLEAATFTIAGQGVTVTPAGLVLAGTAVPAGEVPGIKHALAQAHVTVETIRTTETPDGVTAPGLRISTTQQMPGAGVPGTVTFILGQATASARAGASSAADVTSGSEIPTSDPAPAASASAPSVPAVAPVTVAPVTARAAATADLPSAAAPAMRYAQSVPASVAEPFPAPAFEAAPAPAAVATPADKAELASFATPGSASSLNPLMLFPALIIAGVIVGLALYGQRLVRVR